MRDNNDSNYRDATSGFSREKYQDKYRIPSARLKRFDYALDGVYFVTICTKDRSYFLGNIIDGEMQLSDIGKIANDCWKQIPNHYPFVILREWVVMPNHIHGVLMIDKNTSCVETQYLASQKTIHKIQNIMLKQQAHETQDIASLRGNEYGPQSQNLASIIRGFKIGVTKYVRNQRNIGTIWQSRYYEHIIRNEEELYRIEEYIITNPQNWQNDFYY